MTFQYGSNKALCCSVLKNLQRQRMALKMDTITGQAPVQRKQTRISAKTNPRKVMLKVIKHQTLTNAKYGETLATNY